MDNIVVALKRVISNPDNEGVDFVGEHQEPEMQQRQQPIDASFLATTPDQTPERASFPAVVEMDDPMEVEHGAGTASASSSLSDGHHEHHHNLPPPNVKRMHRNDSHDSSSSSVRPASRDGSGNWGWFEDVHEGSSRASKKTKNGEARVMPRPGENGAAMAVTAPTYVLEESRSSQKLWKNTAGNRPPQPVEERAFYEKMWTQNFVKSQVPYNMPVEVLTATSPISLSPFADGLFQTQMSTYEISEDSKQAADPAEARLMDRMSGEHKDFRDKALEPHQPQHTVVNKLVKGSGDDASALTVLVRGDNVFGTTVSKSFALPSDKGGPIQGVDTVNISIASYRVIESKKHGKFAQYLVIYREGSIRDTIGVWKRYSDFAELSRKVSHEYESCASALAKVSPLAISEEHEVEHLPNAMTSWRLLKKRQRWYRCLDAGYLSLKVFLLERFLHDILFESTSPNLLREFVGAETFDGESISSNQS